MNGSPLSRGALALLIAGVLIGGFALGSAVTAGPSPANTVQPTPSASPPVSPPVSADVTSFPEADVAGEDLDRLPRYPGSVRTEYEVSVDDRFRLVATEYLGDASLDDVRTFYQGVIEDHGWQRADINYSGNEWTYVLVDGSTEALIEIEVTRGFVEIDLQVSEPVSTPGPEPTPISTPSPTSRPPAAPAPPAPAPPAPAPPDDDGGDDDDGGGDDDSDDDGGSDD